MAFALLIRGGGAVIGPGRGIAPSVRAKIEVKVRKGSVPMAHEQMKHYRSRYPEHLWIRSETLDLVKHRALTISRQYPKLLINVYWAIGLTDDGIVNITGGRIANNSSIAHHQKFREKHRLN